jgi:hypothetical protein
MSTDIKNCQWLIERGETLVQMFMAHKHFPYKTSPSTAQRFFRRGISTPHGHFSLETVVIGGKRFTSEEAIMRFLLVQQGQSAEVYGKPVPAHGGMTKAALKGEMKRLGLRPQGQSKPVKPKSKNRNR